MDYKKDNTEQSQNEKEVNFVQLTSLSLFKKDTFRAFVCKKTERLATAVYLLTNLLPEDEPLKNRFRDTVLDLVSESLNLAARSAVNDSLFIEGFSAKLLEAISFLELLKMAGLISPMNYEILSREFNSLLRVVEANDHLAFQSQAVSLTEDFFSVPTEYLAEKKDEEVPTVSTTPIMNSSLNDLKGESKLLVTNQTVSYKGQNNLKDSKINNVLNNMSDKKVQTKTDRSQQIINLLKKDKVLTIKDFVNVIKDCSEKTIQRELLAMVAKGLIRKEGERRWSHYSLK
jgi:hypothetical protein